MAVSDGTCLTVVKDAGLVSEVFDDHRLDGLHGELAIGHVRYSTAGAGGARNAQPFRRSAGTAEFALAHNGNLINASELSGRAGLRDSRSDSQLIADLIAARLSGACDLETAVLATLPRLQGAFSLVIMDQRRLIGVRDPKGLRPLCLGRLEAGWALASESCALDAIGAHRVRELAAGEVVVIDDGPPRSRHPFPASSVEPRLCLFEFVYIARPDSRLNGRSVYRARREAGARLAEQAPLPDDRRRWPREALVIPVPDSGIAAAEGFAHRSGLPLGSGLVRDRYVGRSFIAPAQTQRSERVRMKFAPLPEQVAGKRLVVVDDSIVRGTTMRALVAMLREAGASEVHLRIASPPYRWPCFFGVDTPDRSQLLAADRTDEEMRDVLACDTLACLDLDGALRATGADPSGFCTGCVSGRYPLPVGPPPPVQRRVSGRTYPTPQVPAAGTCPTE
jgi:amidophosphoribosyltransferase